MSVLAPPGESAAVPPQQTTENVSLKAKLAYASPGLPLQVLHFAALAILPAFYAKHTAVSVTAIGLTLLATRIFDALFHPLVGFVSDRFISSKSGRKPWIVTGAMLCAISAYAIFTPSSNAGVGYYFFWSVMLFASWTVLEIPHRAWGSELTRDYFERSRVFAVLAQFRMVGSILFLGAPLLPFFASSDIIRPQFLTTAALVLAFVFPLSAVAAVTGAPAGKIVARKRSTLRGLVKSFARNKPLWIFAGVFALSGIGSGLYNSVLLLFVSDYLKLGNEYPYIGLLYFAVSLPMMSVWGLLMNRIGKHRAWALGMMGFAVVLPLYWFVPPGPGSFHLVLAFTFIFAAASSSDYLIPMAALGDIVDYDILKTGVNRSGNYFSLLQFVQAAQIAIGGGLGFLLLGLFHYSAKGGNGPVAVLGLKLTLLVFPSVLYFLAAILILRSPITARRHDIIRRRITARAERQDRRRS